jgi:hypothetical protein
MSMSLDEDPDFPAKPASARLAIEAGVVERSARTKNAVKI